MTTSTFYGGPISIHALLTEGDSPKRRAPAALGDFNPRPPHGGRRQEDIGVMQVSNFNPRPPHGGRLFVKPRSTGTLVDFNPRPPHGGRRWCILSLLTPIPISIHALLTEGDPPPSGPVSAHPDFNPRPPHGGRLFVKPRSTGTLVDFNPRPPHGGRQCEWADYPAKVLISIHALLTEGDGHIHPDDQDGHKFQSTPSSRRATRPPKKPKK